jgi:hypothetical protein
LRRRVRRYRRAGKMPGTKQIMSRKNREAERLSQQVCGTRAVTAELAEILTVLVTPALLLSSLNLFVG